MRFVWVVALLGAGCIDAASVQCEDGSTCPSGTTCKQVADSLVCASSTQLAQSTRAAELDACGDSGNCHDGVCLPIVCGNGRMDLGEACDDGNAITGDGCAGDCQSAETCGNGVVDPLKLVGGIKTLNEECDDGNLASGDGCSSRCIAENLVWQQLRPVAPPSLAEPGLAYDVGRRRMVQFGGRQAVAGSDFFSTDVFEWNNVGWVGQTPPVAPIGRSFPGMVYDAARHQVVMFGGNVGDDDASLADMWFWDGDRWTPSTVPTPSRRTTFGMVYDSVRKVTVLFGGFGYDGASNTYLNDTWEWDGTAWKQITTTTAPDPRGQFVMAFDPKRGVTVLASGYKNGGGVPAVNYLDTWEYDGAWHKSAATLTTAIVEGAMAYDPIGKRMIAYGGGSVARTLSYDGTAWTPVPGAVSPGVINRQAMATDWVNGTIVMYGGDNGTPLNGTYLWNGTAWSAKQTQPGLPTTTSNAQAAYDPIAGKEWMFGGEKKTPNGTGGFNEVSVAEMWSFDGSLWKSVVTTNPPSAREGGAAIYDVARHQMLMFGGLTAVTDTDVVPVTDATWLWDGAAWKQPTVTQLPTPRAFPVLGYDFKRNVVVMSGGEVTVVTGDATPLTDAWEWDGDWHPIAAPPVARLGGSAYYDPDLGVVFRDGVEATFAPSPPIAWNGTTWTQLANDPVSFRIFARTFFEPFRKKALLVDGLSVGGGSFGDMWESAGQTMVLQTVASQPPSRGGGLVFPGPNGSDLILAGGIADNEATSSLPDIWRLRRSSATPIENCNLSIDADGDGLVGCADPDCFAACSPVCPTATTCLMAAPTCGDGVCNAALENCRNCAADCTCTAVCGDTFCDATEDHASCPGDCP